MPDLVPDPASRAHGPQDEEVPPKGLILPLNVVPAEAARSAVAPIRPEKPEQAPYSPEKQHDYVRLTVTVGLLLILGYLVVFASVESASWPAHWQQTKEMLQIILPAITGIIGTVIGFYFGSAAIAGKGQSGDDSD